MRSETSLKGACYGRLPAETGRFHSWRSLTKTMVNMEVNSGVVSAAKIAIRLRRRFAPGLASSFRIHFSVFDIHRSHLPLVLGDDPTIFDTDNAVCHLRNFFVVSDHYDCLGELLTGDFQRLNTS